MVGKKNKKIEELRDIIYEQQQSDDGFNIFDVVMQLVTSLNAGNHGQFNDGHDIVDIALEEIDALVNSGIIDIVDNDSRRETAGEVEDEYDDESEEEE